MNVKCDFKTDIIIFIGLLILASIVLLLTAGQSAIDIQLHDTYFVLDRISLAVLIIGPSTDQVKLAKNIRDVLNEDKDLLKRLAN